jgi:WD repeat-containing protein 48
MMLRPLVPAVISASSDRTIRAWSPHSSSSDASTSSTVIGHHTDFVRCLAHSRHQSWVASGGFDRHIKLWDVSSASLASVGSGGHPTPLLVLNQSEERTEKSSIYSLATNVQGSMVASGSPEQTVNVWDPRMGGAKRIAKLVGHTDNVRSLLLSEDGRFLLSGSADATVKLWSMSARE